MVRDQLLQSVADRWGYSGSGVASGSARRDTWELFRFEGVGPIRSERGSPIALMGWIRARVARRRFASMGVDSNRRDAGSVASMGGF